MVAFSNQEKLEGIFLFLSILFNVYSYFLLTTIILLSTVRLSKSSSSIWGPGHILHGVNKSKNSLEGTKKTLPIINPLVRLPAWPNVSGLVGRCLLANADALCAAVSPLMDPQVSYSKISIINFCGNLIIKLKLYFRRHY